MINGQTGLHVPVGDHEALAAAITKLLKNDSLRWQLSANSRAMAQNFGWPSIAQQLTGLFEQVIGEREPAHSRSPVYQRA